MQADKVLSSNGLEEVLKLAPEFERATSREPVARSDSSTGVKRASRNGAEFDPAIAAPERIDRRVESVVRLATRGLPEA